MAKRAPVGAVSLFAIGLSIGLPLRSSSQQMSELVPFGAKIPDVVLVGPDANGNLLDDFQTIALEPDDFLWIVSQQSDCFQTQVHKDLRAETVLTQVHGK